MLGILHHIRRFLLSARKRYSPVRLLQYLLALCRAVFSRCKSKCNDQDSSHEFLPKILTPAEGKGSLSEEGTVNPVGHVISGSRTPKQVEEGGAQIAEIFPSNDLSESPLRQDACTKSILPFKKCLRCMWTNNSSLFNMVFLLDHPGFIQRSFAHTQIEHKDDYSPAYTHSKGKPKVWSTDVEKWCKFSRTYTEDIQQVGLLATVLLAANMSFLAIQSIDQAPGGLSYLPQIFSYLSLLAALASIMMGSAVRSPRLFINRGRHSFRAMLLILGFPFELFLYSILSFLLALLIHCAKHKAVVQLIFAGIFAALLLCCLIIYWLITEPCNDINSFGQHHQGKDCHH